MAGALKITIHGLSNVTRALDKSILNTPARNMLTHVGLLIQGSARKKAPVDRGGLMDKIIHEVDPSYFPRHVEVGTNLEYGRATEFGRPPGIMPPVEPLEAWAQRKGMGAGAGWPLAIRIMQRGTKPQPFLMPALNETQPRIPGLVSQMATEIEKAAADAGGGA